MEKKVSDDISVSEMVSVEITPQSGSTSLFEYSVTTPASTIVSDSTSKAGVTVSPEESKSLINIIEETKETYWDITINLGIIKFSFGRKKKAKETP